MGRADLSPTSFPLCLLVVKTIVYAACVSRQRNESKSSSRYPIKFNRDRKAGWKCENDVEVRDSKGEGGKGLQRFSSHSL